MKLFFLVVIFSLTLFYNASGQLVLAEVSPTNYYQLADEDDDYPDWIEIFNAGSTAQNLSGLSLTDNAKPKWAFPDYTLAVGERVLVYASGKNKGGLGQSTIDHWETALYEGDDWRLFIGTEDPPADWSTNQFDDSNWNSAQGGIGYGDNDDVTTVPVGTLAFYYRHTFNVTDLSSLDSAILSMDFDDAFIAYLNGVEIARSYNMPDGPANYMTVPKSDHEAQMYNGGYPDVFPISKSKLNSILTAGQNVLAIEVHNIEANSSDLTARTWLHFGIHTPDVFYGPNPSFFSAVSETRFHTDFKIAFGETIKLLAADNTTLDSVKISYLLPGHSMMRVNDTGDWCFTDTPSPAATNGNNCSNAYADKPFISPAAGFYPAEQLITIIGNDIRYTTDGSEPVDTSLSYIGPFAVGANSIIRARSFETGKLAGATATATYFIAEKSDLPVLSITAKPGDLFNDGSSGLAAYDNYNSGIKAPVHLEYFDKAKNLVFSENASMRPVGGYSIAFDQKSMQFSFDEDFGATDEVHYPIFSRDKPHINTYREFRIRNMDDDWNSTRIRDIVANQLALPTHCAAAGYQHMAVFINGEYWGHYGGREVTNEYYVRDNHGADPDKVDEILTSYFENEDYLVDEGTGDDFFSMSDFIIQHDMNDPANLAEAFRRIDWENWVDYFAAEMYLANGDWFSSIYFNNTRMYRAPDLRWRYIMFDISYSQGNGTSETTNILEEALANPSFPNRYTDMMNSLLANPELKSYFINRFADLINEYWKPSIAHAIIDSNANEITNEIPRQSLRWGSLDSLDWRDRIHDLREFHVVRRVYQREQIEQYFNLNNQVDITLRVQPAEAGVIHINTIIPKKYPWAGIYFDGNPITITAVANPGYTFDHWTNNLGIDTLGNSFTINLTSFADFTAHFTGTTKPVDIELSEINYQSDSTRDTGDWVEIKNNADYPIDLTSYILQDRDWFNTYAVPAGTVVQPQERVVIAGDYEKFNVVNPAIANVVGGSRMRLDNSGEEVNVFDRAGNNVLQVAYDNDAPWPCSPAGFGRTLEHYPGINDPNDPTSWFDGCMGGSPGTGFSPCGDDLIISEINYHSAELQDAGDWFELKNQLDIPYDISGWTIRDEENDHLYTIPNGTMLPASGYLVVCEDEAAFSTLHAGVTARIGDLGFGLGNGGDVIRLYDASGVLQLSICYDDAAPWTAAADGNGYTLELGDAYVNLNDPFNWFAGCLGGSPGGPYDPLCIPVGINPVDDPGQINVFPNPVGNELTIRCEQSEKVLINICDAFGKLVYRQVMRSNVSSINTSTWSAGIYFLNVEVDGKLITGKIIKM